MGVDVLIARKKKRNTLESIPGELLLEIVGRVASHSCKDLFNTKLSCKTLYKVGKDEYIFRRVSLDDFPLITRKSMASYHLRIFLDRCEKAGNSEAMYRLGIEHYFENENRIFGIKFLWRAANLGHPEATYMIGIILILVDEDGDEAKQKGMKSIGGLKKSKITRHRIREIREKFVSILESYSYWSKISMVKHIRPTYCTTHKHAKLIDHRGWDGYVDVYSECDACCCDQEMIHLWEVCGQEMTRLWEVSLGYNFIFAPS